MLQGIVGYQGTIRFNSNYPDGTPRKLMDVSKLAEFGWVATIGLKEGVQAVYNETFSR